MSRYVAERVGGAWQVTDTNEGLPVRTWGAGSVGALASRACAEQLNKECEARARSGFSPADLLQWRTAHGLAQTALAKHLGVSWLAILRWEHGDRAIPPLLERALRDLDRELAST